MNVSLTKELEEYVKQKVAGGMYHSASEVIREALRLFTQLDKLRQIRLEELRKEVAIGIEEADRGELIPLETAKQKRRFIEGVKARGSKLLKKRKSA